MRWKFPLVASAATLFAVGAVALALPSDAATTTLFVATTGSDSGAGTQASPYKTINKAVSVAQAGQTILVRGGTYRPTSTIKATTSGTAASRITLRPYSAEKVVLDLSSLPSGNWGLDVRANYWIVQDLEVKNGPSHAIVCTSCSYDIFQRLNSHDNQDSGLALRGANTVGNLISNSDFHHNHDDVTLGQNADGLAIKFGSGAGNVIRGVRLYDNSDDGLDTWAFTSPIKVLNSWAYGNGVNRWNIKGFEGNGNGFKLGGGSPVPAVAHVVTGSKAWDNAGNGFTENSNPGSLVLTKNTAFRNSASGYFFSVSTAKLTANLDLKNTKSVSIGGKVTASGNSWQSSTAAKVANTDPTVAEGARAADGSLPSTTFLVDSTGRYGAA